MNDELLVYYNQELAFIRRLGEEFGKAHPGVAARLQLAAGASKDPHVERLIEAFALLNARTRLKLDDDFPEIAEAFLQVVSPNYLCPFPSAAIVQLGLGRHQADLLNGYHVPRGSELETEAIDGVACRFRTCYATTVWPIEVASASFRGPPFQAPEPRQARDVKAILKVELNCLSPQATFAQLNLDRLTFFLNGQSQYMCGLYELLCHATQEVALVGGGDREGGVPITLGRASLKPLGFGREEGLLDDSPRAFSGYRLLREYFAFPEKYLFFELSGWKPKDLSRLGNKLEIYVYLNRYQRDLERQITSDTLKLGCTPMVNLFPLAAEPIQLTLTQPEYHVIPDCRRPAAYEAYSLDRVEAITPDQKSVEFRPFYSTRHGAAEEEARYWCASRRPANFAGGVADAGTELYLSFVDLNFRPAAPADWVVKPQLTCTNRDLPNRLAFGGDRPRLQFVEGSQISLIRCLTQPTPARRPASYETRRSSVESPASARHGVRWRLISQLSLNHLSLVDTPEGLHALQEVLRLHDTVDSPETQAQIAGLIGVRSKPDVARTGASVGSGFCRGVRVELLFDEEKFQGAGVYLFASVLEQFLGLYCSVNSFTRTEATTRQRAEKFQWPPRAGEQTLV